MWEDEERILGVIGGMGSEATKLFHEMIIENTDACCDQEHLNMIIFNHASMPDRTRAILSGETDAVRSYLVADAKRLESLGCVALAMTCNTAHYFAKDIQSAVKIPLINMPVTASKAAKKAGAKKVGILATDGTVKTGIYQSALEACGLEYAVPGEAGQRAVMSVIYDDIKAGRGVDFAHLMPAITELKAQGCDRFILGCTELSVLGKSLGLPTDEYIDAMEQLAIACIECVNGDSSV